MPRATFGPTMRRIATLLFFAATMWLALATTASADVFDDNPATASRGPGDGWIFARANDGSILERHLVSDKWTDWVSLGGNAASGPAAVAYGNSMLVFVRGVDGATYENTLQSNGWTGWRSLGGYATSAPAATARRSEDALDLVVSGGDNQLYHQAFTPGGGWSGFAADRRQPHERRVDELAGARILNIWSRGTDGAVQQRSWTPAWAGSAGRVLGGGIIGAPTSVSRAENVINVYVRGAGNATYQRSWTSNGWGAWALLDPAPMDSSPAAGGDRTRTASGSSRARASRSRTSEWTPAGGWTAWQDIGPVAVPAAAAAAAPARPRPRRPTAR